MSLHSFWTGARGSGQARLGVSLGASVLLCASAPAQSGERVDPGVEDVNPNAVSFLVDFQDLRGDVGFTHVYRAPGGNPLFYRKSGALTAVFDRSEYVSTRDGTVPVIPANTIFYIGDPGEAGEAAPAGWESNAPSALPPTASASRIDLKLDEELATQAATGRVIGRTGATRLETWVAGANAGRDVQPPVTGTELAQADFTVASEGSPVVRRPIDSTPDFPVMSDEPYRRARLEQLARKLMFEPSRAEIDE